MSKLNELIIELQKDEVIIKFKKLEKIIDQDININNKFKELLELQKKMVNDRESNSDKYIKSKEVYETAKSAIVSNIVVSEYIDLLEEINYDLQMIQNIIETEISVDFE